MTQQPAGIVLEFTIGDRLRKAREYAGYDQGPFAALLEVSRGTVSNYERGVGERRKPIVVREWARITGVSRKWIETGEGNPTDPDGSRETGRGATTLDELTEAKRGRATRRTNAGYVAAAA